MPKQGIYIFFFIVCCTLIGKAQSFSKIDSFRIGGDIKITIDRPVNYRDNKKTIICFYALPNGNTTDETIGKILKPGDDWHFDIQHIGAQTVFIRQQIKAKNFVVFYLENSFKSWPAWKQKHPLYKEFIPHLVDSLSSLIAGRKKEIYLNGHSGGGSFVFGYLAGVNEIPAAIKRISFLDSDYGYDSSYYKKIQHWLNKVKGASLNVFAYNDSIALYDGKPFVSATGGTWYRSHLMLKNFQNDYTFSETKRDSLIIYKSSNEHIQFFFKKNLNRGIYHTQQVELNGFIHSIFCGTKNDEKGYEYYGKRAYEKLIK
ncbi:MAG: hypothetical protein ABI091_17210 [Ferruginibacter sp.]